MIETLPQIASFEILRRESNVRFHFNPWMPLELEEQRPASLAKWFFGSCLYFGDQSYTLKGRVVRDQNVELIIEQIKDPRLSTTATWLTWTILKVVSWVMVFPLFIALYQALARNLSIRTFPFILNPVMLTSLAPDPPGLPDATPENAAGYHQFETAQDKMAFLDALTDDQQSQFFDYVARRPAKLRSMIISPLVRDLSMVQFKRLINAIILHTIDSSGALLCMFQAMPVAVAEVLELPARKARALYHSLIPLLDISVPNPTVVIAPFPPNRVFPSEILKIIFRYLPNNDKANIALASRRFRTLLIEGNLWMQKNISMKLEALRDKNQHFYLWNGSYHLWSVGQMRIFYRNTQDPNVLWVFLSDLKLAMRNIPHWMSLWEKLILAVPPLADNDVPLPANFSNFHSNRIRREIALGNLHYHYCFRWQAIPEQRLTLLQEYYHINDKGCYLQDNHLANLIIENADSEELKQFFIITLQNLHLHDSSARFLGLLQFFSRMSANQQEKIATALIEAWTQNQNIHASNDTDWPLDIWKGTLKLMGNPLYTRMWDVYAAIYNYPVNSA